MKQAVLLAAARTYEKDHRDFEKQINYLQEKYGAQDRHDSVQRNGYIFQTDTKSSWIRPVC